MTIQLTPALQTFVGSVSTVGSSILAGAKAKGARSYFESVGRGSWTDQNRILS